MIVSKRLVEDDENVLARKVFVTLVKLYPRGYSILNDGYFVKKIYAASDEEAIRQFNELATKGKLLTENISNRIDSDSDSTLKEERKIITIKKEVERKWYISNANDGRYISDEYGIVFDFDFDKAKSFDTKEHAVSAIDYMKNSREWKYFNPKPKFRIFHVDTDISSSEDTVNESIVNNNKSIQSKNVKKQVVEAKHKTLVESVMSDLDLEVKEAGGKEAWIANIDEQIDDLSHYLNYLKKSAYNEVNRGGNFESTDEVDEAIRNCEKQLGLLKSKKQIIEERLYEQLKDLSSAYALIKSDKDPKTATDGEVVMSGTWNECIDAISDIYSTYQEEADYQKENAKRGKYKPPVNIEKFDEGILIISFPRGEKEYYRILKNNLAEAINSKEAAG